MKKYEFTFENGDRYYGTVEDKNFFVKHLTKNEKIEMGKIINKRVLTVDEWRAWEKERDEFLAWI